MIEEDLKNLIKKIQNIKTETQTIELKAANNGVPKKLFDTLSSFSNQDEGGIIIFGVDENKDYNVVGVYDPKDLQTQVTNQGLQMSPVVRPLFTVTEIDGKVVVSAEIPAADVSERPCFYSGVGRIKGSYIRVGDADVLMTEYEIYSYEAFRKNQEDDIRVIERSDLYMLNRDMVSEYLIKLKKDKPNLSKMPEEMLYKLFSITKDEKLTIASLMLFTDYPQAVLPQLGIICVVIPGLEVGEIGENNERFIDNKRINGNIQTMLDEAVSFVNRNMGHSTIINPKNGKREDRSEYPLNALREAILNALVHRDYSMYSENMPIEIKMFRDRIEIHNPGGLYGRLTLNDLGKVQADTRNPVIANVLEVLGITENRYSGIPTMRREMEEMGLEPPVFENARGSFNVKFYNGKRETNVEKGNIIEFCKVPKSKREIADFLGISSIGYVTGRYINPLVNTGVLHMTMPDKPRSKNQKYYSGNIKS